jgi:hypothetical protein
LTAVEAHTPRKPHPLRDPSRFRNHATQIYACDFLTQYTALFSVAYIFVVMEIASRRIVLINVTTSPSLAWVKHQIREATAWGDTPRFWLHDNDGIFGQYRQRERRGCEDRRYRCHLGEKELQRQSPNQATGSSLSSKGRASDA